ncbi:MAG: hypothetical protein K9H64_21160 [Bacteroidales bacterium]|nr:hypothetical protein [Bacteroidales bacterium]MCF8458536.1 hypothetical protein [Bacteroidales bacterium]
MNLQYISDYKGKTTGVFIPIQEWDSLKKNFPGLEEGEFYERSHEEILEGVKQAVSELNLAKEGKLKTRSAKDLLDEL